MAKCGRTGGEWFGAACAVVGVFVGVGGGGVRGARLDSSSPLLQSAAKDMHEPQADKRVPDRGTNMESTRRGAAIEGLIEA
jgi:hypothetical protein